MDETLKKNYMDIEDPNCYGSFNKDRTLCITRCPRPSFDRCYQIWKENKKGG